MQSGLRQPPNLFACLYLCDQVQRRLELVYDVCAGGGTLPDELVPDVHAEIGSDSNHRATAVAAAVPQPQTPPDPFVILDGSGDEAVGAALAKKKKKNKKKKKKPKAAAGQDVLLGPDGIPSPSDGAALEIVLEIPSPDDGEGLEAAAAALAKGAHAVATNREAAARWFGSFDIISGPFSCISQLYTAPSRAV